MIFVRERSAYVPKATECLSLIVMGVGNISPVWGNREVRIAKVTLVGAMRTEMIENRPFKNHYGREARTGWISALQSISFGCGLNTAIPSLHFTVLLSGAFLSQHSNTFHSHPPGSVSHLLSVTRPFQWPQGLSWYLTCIMWPYPHTKHTNPDDGCDMSLGNTDPTAQSHTVPLPQNGISIIYESPWKHKIKSCKVVVTFYPAVSRLLTNNCARNPIHLCRFLLRASDIPWCSVSTRTLAFSIKKERPALLEGQFWQQ
jgi:hypothetical protein